MKKEMTLEYVEKQIRGPLSEDLPPNIEEIDKVVGEASLSGRLDLDISRKMGIKVFKELLEEKGIRLGDYPIDDAFYKAVSRFINGESSWDLGIAERDKESLDHYQGLKDLPVIKKVIELGGVTRDTLGVVSAVKAINDLLAKGGTYAEAFSTIIYEDDPWSNHALLAHVEDKFNTAITSYKQLQELAQIPEGLADEVEDTFTKALEDRYALALCKILNSGGDYKELIALDPKDFGLPEKWNGMWKNTTKEKEISRAIRSHYGLEPFPLNTRLPLREVASRLEAPYSVVLGAVTGGE